MGNTDLTDVLVSNGANVNTDYNNMESINLTNYQNTNSSSIPDIIKAININLAELNLKQTKSTVLNNINQETLVKKNQLLRMKNDDLLKQLRQLEDIELRMSNRNRMIEQTNENIRKQDLNIYVLIICAILAIILLIAVMIYRTGRINDKILQIISIIIIVLYVLIFMYAYNIFYYRDAITYFFVKKQPLYGKEIQTWVNTTKSNIQKNIYGTESAWVNSNCSCPPSEEEESPNNAVYATDANISETEVPGYFYNDGTSPQQLIVPTPVPGMLNESIDWVDFDSLNHNVASEDTHYYNNNSNTDPRIKSLRNLQFANNFVNSNTLTANM
jgi:hypothetical protein